MSYEVKYDAADEVANARAAIIDALRYLGAPTFRHLVRCLRRYPDTPHGQVRVALMMQGVQGYPVQAIIARYLP